MQAVLISKVQKPSMIPNEKATVWLSVSNISEEPVRELEISESVPSSFEVLNTEGRADNNRILFNSTDIAVLKSLEPNKSAALYYEVRAPNKTLLEEEAFKGFGFHSTATYRVDSTTGELEKDFIVQLTRPFPKLTGDPEMDFEKGEMILFVENDGFARIDSLRMTLDIPQLDSFMVKQELRVHVREPRFVFEFTDNLGNSYSELYTKKQIMIGMKPSDIWSSPQTGTNMPLRTQDIKFLFTARTGTARDLPIGSVAELRLHFECYIKGEKIFPLNEASISKPKRFALRSLLRHTSIDIED